MTATRQQLDKTKRHDIADTQRVTRPSQKGISPFRNPDTAQGHGLYLGEVEGISTLEWQPTVKLGFADDQFEELETIHHTLLQTWSFKDVDGPKDKSLKETSQFRKLEDLHMDSIVDFYTFFQCQVLGCNIALTPFDAIVLKWQHIGLCPPGVGSKRYIPMAKALFILLTRLIPMDDPNVASWVGIIQNDGSDGYKLLWRVLAIALPGFSSTVVPIFPRWENVRDVTLFAKLVTLHFRLIAKKGNFNTEKEKSLLYLRGIQEMTLQGSISSLVTAVESHRNVEFDDDYLPENLMIAHLAQRITLDYAGIQGGNNNGRRIHRSYMDADYDDDYDRYAYPPLVNALDQRRPTTRPPYPSSNREPTLPYQRRNEPASGHRNRRPEPSNRSPYDANAQCRACGRTGHHADTCFDLGKALVMGDYISNHRNADLCARVKESWRQRNVSSPPPATASSRPRIVMAYVDRAGMTTEQMVEEYDWDHFMSCDLPDGETHA